MSHYYRADQISPSPIVDNFLSLQFMKEHTVLSVVMLVKVAFPNQKTVSDELVNWWVFYQSVTDVANVAPQKKLIRLVRVIQIKNIDCSRDECTSKYCFRVLYINS